MNISCQFERRVQPSRMPVVVLLNNLRVPFQLSMMSARRSRTKLNMISHPLLGLRHDNGVFVEWRKLFPLVNPILFLIVGWREHFGFAFFLHDNQSRNKKRKKKKEI